MIRKRKTNRKRSCCREVSDQNRSQSLLFSLCFSLIFREIDMHRFQKDGFRCMNAKRTKKTAAKAAGDR